MFVCFRYEKKVQIFDETLKNLEEYSLKPKMQKLRLTQEALNEFKEKCEILERNNRKLENEIALLEKS